MTVTAQTPRALPSTARNRSRGVLARAGAAGRTAGSWRWLRLVVGVALLGAMVARLGTGPFRDGLAEVTVGLVTAAVVTTAVSTVCSAWRWRLVAGRLGLDVPPGVAVAAYYRSQLLNAALPGGVTGDLHRGVRQGAGSGAVGLGLRSVGWERVIGQLVQVAVLLVLLVAVPSSLRGPGRFAAAAVVLVAGCLLAVTVARQGGRLARAVAADLGAVLGDGRTSAAVVLLSLGAAAGHAALFVLAAHATSADLPPSVLLVLAVLVLVAAAVPTNVAGWGPREGAAAWAFAAAGGSAAVGVSAAALYGVLALAGTLPGAVLLVADRRVVGLPPAPRAGAHRA